MQSPTLTSTDRSPASVVVGLEALEERGLVVRVADGLVVRVADEVGAAATVEFPLLVSLLERPNATIPPITASTAMTATAMIATFRPVCEGLVWGGY